jgi:hypothetical protein
MKRVLLLAAIFLAGCSKEGSKEMGNISNVSSTLPQNYISLNGSFSKVTISRVKSYPGISYISIQGGEIGIQINIDTPNNIIKLKWSKEPRPDVPFKESDDYVTFQGISHSSIRYIGTSLYIGAKFQYKDVVEINATVK